MAYVATRYVFATNHLVGRYNMGTEYGDELQVVSVQGVSLRWHGGIGCEHGKKGSRRCFKKNAVASLEIPT